MTLYGDQCLVFFLAGIPQAGTRGLGFSTNPTNPALPTADMKSFFQFETTRLVTNLRATVFPSYLDAYSSYGKGNPILYFSASIRKPKNGYFEPLKVPVGFLGAQVDKVTGNIYITQSILGLSSPLTQSSYSQNATYTTVNPFYDAVNGIVPTNGINPFFISNNFPNPPNPGKPMSPFQANTPTPAPAFVCPADDSYQIVTAGRDQVFGPGGQWSADSNHTFNATGTALVKLAAAAYDVYPPPPSAGPFTTGIFDSPNGNGQDDFTSFSDRRMGTPQ